DARGTARQGRATGEGAQTGVRGLLLLGVTPFEPLDGVVDGVSLRHQHPLLFDAVRPRRRASMLALTRKACQHLRDVSAFDDRAPRRRRPPVMADVAALAGVSHQTVSRVINDSV